MRRKVPGQFAYQTVYHYLQSLIGEAERSGQQRLPSLRCLSRRLGVSLVTVQSAYGLLEHEGRVISVPKSGYFVRAPTSAGHPAESLTTPAPAAVPAHALLERSLLAHERRVSRQRERAPSAWAQTGSARLRGALAERYTRSSQQYWRAEDVHLGPDVQSLLETLLGALTLHGATALVYSPCCWRLLRALQRAGMRVLDVPTQRCGNPDVEALAELLDAGSVRMLVVPSCLGMPSGRLMSQQVQQQIAHLLARHPVWLLENDLDSEHCFNTPPRSRLRDRVDPRWLLVLGSLEAVVGAEAPYAYVLSQHAALIEAIDQRAFQLAPLRLQALARMFARGEIDVHLGQLRVDLHSRMAVFARQLQAQLGDQLAFDMPEGGRTLWVRLRHPVPSDRVVSALSGSALLAVAGARFGPPGRYQRYLALDWLGDQPERLREALDTLGQALELRCGRPVARER